MPRARRSFFQRLAGWGAAAASGARLEAQRAPVPVETPDVPKLPWKMVDGVKEFHLVAEPVHKDLMPGRPVDVWGFNGSMPGPTIEVNQGDRVRIVFENKLPEISAVHWHGLEVPIAMDGVPDDVDQHFLLGRRHVEHDGGIERRIPGCDDAQRPRT